MTPLANLASIAEHGLLSHQRVAQLPHASGDGRGTKPP
jgi:hypothetical protein